MTKWSKALVLGTSHFDAYGVCLNPVRTWPFYFMFLFHEIIYIVSSIRAHVEGQTPSKSEC